MKQHEQQRHAASDPFVLFCSLLATKGFTIHDIKDIEPQDLRELLVEMGLSPLMRGLVTTKFNAKFNRHGEHPAAASFCFTHAPV